MLLAIETSSLVSSVALLKEEKLVAELTIQTRLTHSEQLMPHIKDLLEKTATKKSDIHSIAVSVGPGSFTGLRIGLATAKGLAYAWQVPIVGVLTPEGVAWNCVNLQGLLCPLIDAQQGNVYQTVYSWQKGVLNTIIPTRIISLDDLLVELSTSDQAVTFFGDGALLGREKIVTANPDFQLAVPTAVIPRAGSIALAGYERVKAGKVDDCLSLVPYYMRRSEAEVLWEKRHRESR